MSEMQCFDVHSSVLDSPNFYVASRVSNVVENGSLCAIENRIHYGFKSSS